MDKEGGGTIVKTDRTEELKWIVMETVSNHGFILSQLEWDEESPKHKINWTSYGPGIEIRVLGIPMSIDNDEFVELLEKALTNRTYSEKPQIGLFEKILKKMVSF